ncbi:hypothetical protein ACFFRR_002945 [Megaselia abdita]
MSKFRSVAKIAATFKSELVVPDHLTTEFFQLALQNGLSLDDVAVEEILFSVGATVRENSSDIFRVVVNFTYSSNGKQSKEISLIVKTIKSDTSNKNELLMNRDIIPQLNKLWTNEEINFAPKCFYISSDPVPTYVFEDLISSGFRLGDHVGGLNEEHSRILIRKIAQFHATTMVLADKEPELLKPFSNLSLTNDITNANNKNYIENLDELADIIEPWLGYGEISDKLRDIEQNFSSRISKCVENRPDGIKVLNHGDLWINNVLFKYEKDTPKDLSFIDLQMSYHGSPGLDLNFFFNTSVQLSVLKDKRTSLEEEYYNQLQMSLKKLDFDKIPTLKAIQQEILDKEFYGFWAMVQSFPMTSFSRDDTNIELYNDMNEIHLKRKMMFSSNRMTDTLKYSLLRFDELGIFN